MGDTVDYNYPHPARRLATSSSSNGSDPVDPAPTVVDDDDDEVRAPMLTGQYDQLLPPDDGKDPRNEMGQEIHELTIRVRSCVEMVSLYQVKLELNEFTDMYAKQAGGYVEQFTIQLSQIDDQLTSAIRQDSSMAVVQNILNFATDVANTAESDWSQMKQKFSKLLPHDETQTKVITCSKYNIEDLERHLFTRPTRRLRSKARIASSSSSASAKRTTATTPKASTIYVKSDGEEIEDDDKPLSTFLTKRPRRG